MRKATILLVALLLSSVLLWGCSSGTVASVNGKDITTQQLDEEVAALKANLEQQGYNFDGDQGKELEDLLKTNVLEKMIEQELVMQDAEHLKLMPTDKEIEGELAGIKEQLGSEGEYKKYLASYGLNEPKLKEMIKQQMAWTKLQDKITADVAEPTEEEMQAYYDSNKEQYSQPEQRQVSHILIGAGDNSNGKNRSEADAKVLALQVVDKLNAGADFAELAKEYSDDAGSKDNGGQYPPFSRGSGFVQEFEDAAFELNKGETTAEPVRTDFGYHVIRLDDVIQATQMSFAEVKDSISAGLMEEKTTEKMTSYVEELRGKAEIVNKLADKAGSENKENTESKENESNN